MRKQQPVGAQQEAMAAGLDVDTVVYGVDGPFEHWEAEHTALVHVLWCARSRGLTLLDDALEIARLIDASRCMAAVRALAAAGSPPVPVVRTRTVGTDGAVQQLALVLEDARRSGGDLCGADADAVASMIRRSGLFAAAQSDAIRCGAGGTTKPVGREA